MLAYGFLSSRSGVTSHEKDNSFVTISPPDNTSPRCVSRRPFKRCGADPGRVRRRIDEKREGNGRFARYKHECIDCEHQCIRYEFRFYSEELALCIGSDVRVCDHSAEHHKCAGFDWIDRSNFFIFVQYRERTGRN